MLVGRDEVRAAARAKAAEAREAARRRRRRNRALAIGGGVLAVVVVAGGVTTAVVAGAGGGSASAATGSASSSAPTGRTSAPPWAAPTDVAARVRAAGLRLLTAEGTALHIHQHLSVTVDGEPAAVPAGIGIDEAAQRISAIHVHDDSGIVHVESPTVTTFRLGQVFTEWDVALAPGRVGSYVDGRDGTRIALFVDGKRDTADPRTLALASKQDIDFVITTDGSTPQAPTTRFTFPAGY